MNMISTILLPIMSVLSIAIIVAIIKRIANKDKKSDK